MITNTYINEIHNLFKMYVQRVIIEIGRAMANTEFRAFPLLFKNMSQNKNIFICEIMKKK